MYKFPMLEYSRGTVNVSAEYTAADAGILPQSEIAMTATAHRQTDNSKTAAATPQSRAEQNHSVLPKQIINRKINGCRR